MFIARHAQMCRTPVQSVGKIFDCRFLCATSVSSVSRGEITYLNTHHRDTEGTEVAQRKTRNTFSKLGRSAM